MNLLFVCHHKRFKRKNDGQHLWVNVPKTHLKVGDLLSIDVFCENIIGIKCVNLQKKICREIAAIKNEWMRQWAQTVLVKLLSLTYRLRPKCGVDFWKLFYVSLFLFSSLSVAYLHQQDSGLYQGLYSSL